MADDSDLIARLHYSCATLSEVADLIAGLEAEQRENLREVTSRLLLTQKFMTGMATNLSAGLGASDSMMKAK